MVDTPNTDRSLPGSSLALLRSVAHRAHVFFSQLWSSSIKAALSIPPPAPPIFSSLQSKIGAKAFCVVRPSPCHGLWCGVDYQRQEKRDTDLWNTVHFFFHLSYSQTTSRMRGRDLQYKDGEYTVRQGGGGGRYRDIHCQCPPLM